MIKVTKRWTRNCGFCNSKNGEYYIYPLPEEYRTDIFLGLLACGKCFPEIRQRQLDEGLLLPPEQVELDTSWKEE